MKDKGIAHIGIGSGKGDDKATDAVKMAVESPLLETKVNGATDVIINISGDITLTDASDASEYVRQLAGDNVNVIFGAMYDESKTDTCTVTVIATGIEDKINNTNNQAVVEAQNAAAKATQTVTAQTATVTPTPTVQPVVTPITPVQPTITPIGTPASDNQPATSSATRPLSLNRPTNITSTVEPKSLKIPDFLQRK
jgi:cell division protein FtsZ